MNRSIKFRAWADGGMHYGGFSIHATDGKVLSDVPWINENSIIMQYTGLKDRNGVEIYEKDRMHDPDHIMSECEVRFINGCFIVFFYSVGDGSESPLHEIAHRLEVIGNIHTEEGK